MFVYPRFLLFGFGRLHIKMVGKKNFTRFFLLTGFPIYPGQTIMNYQTWELSMVIKSEVGVDQYFSPLGNLINDKIDRWR